MSNPPSTYYRMHKALEGYAAPSRGVNSAPHETFTPSLPRCGVNRRANSSNFGPTSDAAWGRAVRITARKSGTSKTVCDPLRPGFSR